MDAALGLNKRQFELDESEVTVIKALKTGQEKAKRECDIEGTVYTAIMRALQ